MAESGGGGENREPRVARFSLPNDDGIDDEVSFLLVMKLSLKLKNDKIPRNMLINHQ